MGLPADCCLLLGPWIPFPLRDCSRHPRKSAKNVTLARPSTSLQEGRCPACGRTDWAFSLCSLVPFSGPLAQASLGGDLHLAFGSFRPLGNHFCHRLPEPNTFPWGSFPALLFLSNWLGTYCSLSPALYSFQHTSSFLVVRGPAGEVRIRAPRRGLLGHGLCQLPPLTDCMWPSTCLPPLCLFSLFCCIDCALVLDMLRFT